MKDGPTALGDGDVRHPVRMRREARQRQGNDEKADRLADPFARTN